MCAPAFQIGSSIATRIVAALALAVGLSACAAHTPQAPTAPDTVAVMSRPIGNGVTPCIPDSEFIAMTELSVEDKQGTWWSNTREGLDAAGITDYEAFIESVFGEHFEDLDAAVEFVVDLGRPLDENANNLGCAYAVRGTRTGSGLPYVTPYTFATIDDRIID
jgi:hypothetical protein